MSAIIRSAPRGSTARLSLLSLCANTMALVMPLRKSRTETLGSLCSRYASTWNSSVSSASIRSSISLCMGRVLHSISIRTASPETASASTPKRQAKIDNHFSPSSQQEEGCVVLVILGVVAAGLVGALAVLAKVAGGSA